MPPRRSDSPQLSSPPKSTPTFSPKDVSVIFVLGGPGAGKGTQCANLVRDYGFTHLSAGDLLRDEQNRKGSEFGDLIRDYIKSGDIVPMEITVALLENAIRAELDKSKAGSSTTHDTSKASNETPDPRGRFLIDGFPRKMDQAVHFDEQVCKAAFVLFFDCPEDELQRRLLHRGETSGREDDNAESIKKRFKVFEETSMPVVEHFEKDGRVEKVDATPKPEKVYETVQQVMKRKGFNMTADTKASSK